MGFIHELGEALDELWEVMLKYHDQLDSLVLDADIAQDRISLRLDLDGDDTSYVHAKCRWEDDTAALLNSLTAGLKKRKAAIESELKAAQERTKGVRHLKDVIKRLNPSPLEELAMAGDEDE